MPRLRVLKWPKEVEIERAGNFRTREAVREGILRMMNPRVKARIKVEREGESNARCQ
jgi:hypothetical protein